MFDCAEVLDDVADADHSASGHIRSKPTPAGESAEHAGLCQCLQM